MGSKREVMDEIESETSMQAPDHKKGHYLPEVVMQVVSNRRSLIGGSCPAGKVAVDKVQISGNVRVLVSFDGVPLAFGRQYPYVMKPRDLPRPVPSHARFRAAPWTASVR